MDTKHGKHLVKILLLVWSMQAAFCKICGSDFEDTRSRALLSDVVAEGTVDIKYENRQNSRYNASVLITKIFKGRIGSSTSQRRVLENIRIGEFGPLDMEQCLIEVTEGLRYIFFLRPTRDKIFYKHASLPVESTKKNLRQVRGILCKGCATPPVIKPMEDIIIEEGEKVQIRCRVRGTPKPLISWAKNGKVLKKRKGVLIRNTRRGSTVRIRKLKIRDAGNYACIARNALQLTREEMFLAVLPFGSSGKHRITTYRPYRQKSTTVMPVTHRYSTPPSKPTPHLTNSTATSSQSISITSIIRSSSSRTPTSTPSYSVITSPQLSSVESILHEDTTTQPSSTKVPTTSSTTDPIAVTTDVSITTSQIAPTGHYYPCEKQTYCLNGGTCVYLPAFKAQFCRCPLEYSGVRCQDFDIRFINPQSTPKTKPVLLAEHQHQDRVVTILGIVIGLLVLIGIFIGAYCKARKRRKAFHKRQEWKKKVMASLETTHVERSGAGHFPKPNNGKKSGSNKPTITRSNSTTQTDPFNFNNLFPMIPNGGNPPFDTTDSPIVNGLQGGMRPRLAGVSSTPMSVRVERDNPRKAAPVEPQESGSKGSTPSQSSQTESAMLWPPVASAEESNSKPDNDLNHSDYENLDDSLENKLSVVPPYLSYDSQESSYNGQRDLPKSASNTRPDNRRRKSPYFSSDSDSDSEETSSGGFKPECEVLLPDRRLATPPKRWNTSQDSAGDIGLDEFSNNGLSGLARNKRAFNPYVESDILDDFPHRQKPNYKTVNDREQSQRLLRTPYDHDATRL